MTNFCPNCGVELQFKEAEICPKCGVRIKAPPNPTETRNPWIAIILSFLVVGWGQWYNGKTWDGLKFFGAFWGFYLLMIILSIMMPILPSAIIIGLILFVVLIGIWIYGMYDAYQTADKINKGEESFSGKSGLFWLPVTLLILAIVVIIAAVIAAFVFGMSGGVVKTKNVAVAVRQVGDYCEMTEQGGADFAALSSITVTCGTGTAVTDTAPEVGRIITAGETTSGSDHVIVVANFQDGTSQIVLDTYV